MIENNTLKYNLAPFAGKHTIVKGAATAKTLSTGEFARDALGRYSYRAVDHRQLASFADIGLLDSLAE